MILYWTNSVSGIYISYGTCLSLCILFDFLFPNIEKRWYIDDNRTWYHKKYVNVIGLKLLFNTSIQKKRNGQVINTLRVELEVLMIIYYSYVKRRKEMNIIEYTYLKLNTILVSLYTIIYNIQHKLYFIIAKLKEDGDNFILWLDTVY